MSVPHVIPPLERFGGGECKALRARFNVHKRDLAARAGVHRTMIDRFENRSLRGGYEAKAAVYDALLDLCLEGAQNAVKKIEEARRLHRGR